MKMTLALRHSAAINAWDKVTESGKRREPFFQVMKGPKKRSPDFLPRWTSAEERSVSDPAERKAIMEPLAFANANAECRKVIRPLRAGQHR